jgi:DNA-binding transcriptional regulator YhcF (GntR family)
MKIHLDPASHEPLLDQARGQIISGLHTGMLRRGDRLPSLRRVASLSGLNVKTVMNIYARLQHEGLLVLRRGSGAFVGTEQPHELDPAQAVRLRRLLQRHLDEVSGMNVSPGVYLTLIRRLLTRGNLNNQTVGVLECNEEQVRLFAAEIRSRLGVATVPILLSVLHKRDSAALLRSCSVLSVTDFHSKEGVDIARRFQRPLVRLRLQRDFVPALMDAARRGRLAMIVFDPSFDLAFRRTLGHLGLTREQLERISLVDGSNRQAVRRAVGGAEFIYISPLCDRRIRSLVPAGKKVLDFKHHLADDAMEELESWLLLSSPEAS